MSMNILNDISKVYLDQVVESTLLEALGTPKRWWDDNSNGIGYEKGEVSGKFKKKKKTRVKKESFSDWRDDLSELMEVIDTKKIQEKPIKNKVVINPKLGEAIEELGGTLLEIVELDEKLNMKKAEMGTVIKDFYKSDAPQFKGMTKEKRRKMAVAAKLTAERGGLKLGEQIVGEDLQPETPQQIAAQNAVLMAQRKLASANQSNLKKKTKPTQPLETSDPTEK